MKSIRQFLTSAHQSLVTVSPDDTVYDALVLLAQHNLSAVLVMQGDKLAGIFTERDYARKVVLLNKRSREMPVRDAMTQRPVIVNPDMSFDDCMTLMTSNKVRNLPVTTADNKVLGIISIGDVMKVVMEEQHFLIKELQRYLAS